MKVLGSLLVLPVAIILRGVVLKAFWGWFVLPVFAVLPPLGLMQAVGLAAAMGAFVGGAGETFRIKAIADAVGAKEPEALEASIQALLYPLFLLVFGWVLHLFL